MTYYLDLFGCVKNQVDAENILALLDHSGWAAAETLKYQGNVTYYAEMSLNITDRTYSATLWMLDARGEMDTPYAIAKNFPFRFGGGEPPVPAVTAIDTFYMGSGGDDAEVIIGDFKVVGGE